MATGGVKPPRAGAGAAEELAGREPGPRVGVSDWWQPSTRGEHDDRRARRWHDDRADHARRGVAYREHVSLLPDTGRGFRPAPNGSNPSDATVPIYVLYGIMPKLAAPRLTASSPAACGEFMCLWGEYTQHDTAVDRGITMRSCMTENTLATICYLVDFPTPRVQSMSDADVIEY